MAQDKRIERRDYFTRLRSLVTDPEDLFSFTKRTSAIYRGVLNLIGYAIHGRVGYDWKLRMRARIGAAVTLRYLGLSYADTYYDYEETWRGVSLAGAVSFGWY